MVGASGSITPDGRGKSSRPAFKRSVTWADGTAEPKQVDLALWQAGRAWTIRRRYKDFESFHNDLVLEDIIDVHFIPDLPPKRLFYWNKFDSDFIQARRLALQKYLREIVRFPRAVEESSVLQNFLELKSMRAISISSRTDLSTDVELHHEDYDVYHTFYHHHDHNHGHS